LGFGISLVLGMMWVTSSIPNPTRQVSKVNPVTSL
jgi:hypothetical protein